MNIKHMGWIGAAALLGVMLASGFQGNSQKVGIVDVSTIMADSDYSKRRTDELLAKGNSYRDVIQFLRSHRALTSEQATRYKDLKTKGTLSAAEKAELDKITTDAAATAKKWKDVQTKEQPTPEEVTMMQDYGNRAQTIMKLEQQWAREFEDGFQKMQQDLRRELNDRIEATVAEVAKKHGYSIVFVREVAPYSANDLTQETLTALNAKK